MKPIKNRIKYHKKVKAGELIPHELNPRTHNDAQRDALKALYDEIGFARSLLAYETPQGLKLIDGHLRQSMDPDMEVEVEVLDVTEEEARTLLLSVDPLAALAGYNDEALEALKQTASSSSDALQNLWNSIAQADSETTEALTQAKKRTAAQPVEQFIVLIECTDEKHQVALLRKLRKDGLKCKALMS